MAFFCFILASWFIVYVHDIAKFNSIHLKPCAVHLPGILCQDMTLAATKIQYLPSVKSSNLSWIQLIWLNSAWVTRALGVRRVYHRRRLFGHGGVYYCGPNRFLGCPEWYCVISWSCSATVIIWGRYSVCHVVLPSNGLNGAQNWCYWLLSCVICARLSP